MDWGLRDFIECSLGTTGATLVLSAILLSKGLRYVCKVCFFLVKPRPVIIFKFPTSIFIILIQKFSPRHIDNGSTAYLPWPHTNRFYKYSDSQLKSEARYLVIPTEALTTVVRWAHTCILKRTFFFILPVAGGRRPRIFRCHFTTTHLRVVCFSGLSPDSSSLSQRLAPRGHKQSATVPREWEDPSPCVPPNEGS